MLSGPVAVYRGNASTLALFNPFAGPRVFSEVGMSYGFYLPGYEPFRFDHSYFKNVLGLYTAPVVLVNGRIGSGKTTLVTMIAFNESLIRNEAGYDFKLFMTLTRNNAGKLDFTGLCERYGVSPLDMADQRINIYDPEMGLSAPEHLALIVDAYEYVEESRISSQAVVVMMAAMRKFLYNCANDEEYKKQACDKLFFKELAEVTASDVARSIALGRLWKPEELPSRVIKEGATQADDVSIGELELIGASETMKNLSKYTLSPGDIQLDEAQIKELATDCIMVLSRLSDGDYDGIFSGNGSMSNLFSQNVVPLNLAGLKERTIGFVQQVFWKWKLSAIARNDRRFIYSMEIHDESHTLWRYKTYAVNLATFIKMIRATDTLLCIVSHRFPGDYMTLPPETRELALNALSDADVVFHGPQDDANSKAGQNYFQYTEIVRQWIMGQDRGEFVVVFPGNNVARIQVHLTDAMKAVTENEEASTEKINMSTTLLALEE